jgi:formylglycine-generating enzyme required for sulfatase activity
MRFFMGLAIALLCASSGILPAEARRVALVIGNADYKIGRLTNPMSDAEAMAAAFERQLKFDTVLLHKNLTLEGFRAALRQMAREASGAELGVIYFAGHGIEVGGRNYLIPVDAQLGAARDIELEAVALDTVLGQLDGVRKLKLVILDACRNNPFSLSGAKRSVMRGLSRMEPEGNNTLIAYAAKDGTTAEDGKGKHSPFTEALLKRIATPGLDVRLVFGYVSEDVKLATNRLQEPYLYGQLGGEEIHLVKAPSGPPLLLPPPPGTVAPTKPPVVTPTPPSEQAQPGAGAEMVRICREVEGMSNPATLAVLERQYKGTPAGECVSARLAQLKTAELAKPPPPPPPPKVIAPPPPPPKVIAPPPLLPQVVTPPVSPVASFRPGDSFRDCPQCPEMVVVRAGSFIMGSPPGEPGRFAFEGPQRRVTIARPFAVGKYSVTRGELAIFLAETGRSAGDGCWTFEDGQWQKRAGRSFHTPGFEQDDRHPAVCVSWEDATAFAGWLSRKTGKTYRLLTEAEWEYAARAGTTTPFWWGLSISTAQANYNGNLSYAGGPKGEYRGETVPVDGFALNPWGLSILHGNVWEWVQDCWANTYTGAPTDGSARMTGDCSHRVLRGGTFMYAPGFVRAAYRDRDPIVVRGHNLGFRIARTL